LFSRNRIESAFFLSFFAVVLFFGAYWCFEPTSANAQSEAKIALVSIEKEDFQSFDVANEALTLGAQILLFPEWGFYSQPNVEASVIETWRSYAAQNKVHIVMGARLDSKNAALHFFPNGSVQKFYRRDGHNSQFPLTDLEKKPYVANTEFGKIGVLFCDESRNRKFISEMDQEKIEKLLVVNWVGQPSSEEEITKLNIGFGYTFDVFNTDIAGMFGNRTHVFRTQESKIEFNSFGKAALFSSGEGVKTNARNLRYLISIHNF
jgi:hypothetical protein